MSFLNFIISISLQPGMNIIKCSKKYPWLFYEAINLFQPCTLGWEKQRGETEFVKPETEKQKRKQK